MKQIKAKDAKAVIKDAVKYVKDQYNDCRTFEAPDGSTIEVKGGIKKKGKVVKLELKWDKDFVADDVNIQVVAGCKEINLVSPEKTKEFYVNFGATQKF